MSAFTYAQLVEAFPNVTNAADRAVRYAAPAKYQKIFRLDTGDVEQWDGSAWNVIISGSLPVHFLFSGTGSPEGVVTAGVGAVYLQEDGGHGTVVWAKNSGLGNVGWRALQTAVQVWNVLDFGAVGDGVTDDTAAIALTAAALADGDTLLFPSGNTYLFDPIVITTSATVMAMGATLRARTAINETGLLTFRGSVTVTTCLTTAPATAGDLAITVDDTTGFVAGNWVLVNDTAQASTNFAYEFAKIYAVDSTHLYLAAPLEIPLTYATNTTVTLLAPLTRVAVIGGVFDGGGFGGTNISCLQLDHCFDSRVQEAAFQNIAFTDVDLRNSKHLTLQGCAFVDAAGDRSAASPPDSGYGVNPRLGTGHVTVSGCTFRGLRHGVIVSEGAHSVTVVGNTFHGCYGAALTTHFRRQLNCIFSQNVVTGDVYASPTSLTRGTSSYGAAVSTTDTRVVIADNVFSLLRGAAVRVACDSPQTSVVAITGNLAIECYDPSSNSEGTYYVTNANAVTLTGNTCLRSIDGGATAPACFRVVTARHLTVTGNAAICEASQSSSAVSGFRLGDVQEFAVMGNTVKLNNSGYGIRVDATSSGTTDSGQLTGNTVEVVTGTAFLLSANATNIQQIGNSWNIGSTTAALLGALTVPLGTNLPVGTDLGNASGTLTIGTSAPVQIENTVLTGNRSWGLSTGGGAVNGSRFLIARTANSIGNFSLNIGTGPLIGLRTSEWCIVVYDGSAWGLFAWGSLGGITQTANDNSTKLATTAYVDRATTHTGTTSAAPTGTTSATAVMMGLAGSITPTRGTKIIVQASGQMANNTVNDGATVDLRFGTGSAPTNGAAVTGTLVGIAQTATSLVAAQRSGFCVQGKVTGLSVGTPYWLDLSLLAVPGGTATVTGVSLVAWEVP